MVVSLPIAHAVLSGCLQALGAICVFVGGLLLVLAAYNPANAPVSQILAAATAFGVFGLACLLAARKVTTMNH